jgi:RHS repeat-associated protein
VSSYGCPGNLTTLQRERETGTLVDNLTYSYTAGTNRLAAVSDAVGATAESWDAESGSFTYDANGNLLTASAPYNLTTVTYDERNLPLAVTRAGVTTSYRYNEAGQRIAKRVGSGNTEVYVLEGATPLGVVTVDGAGTPVSWYFTVLAGEKPVGRAPNVGSRVYYHADLLGSTRAVVSGASVLESYDYDPYGVLLPGRTLGSGTKEGFTGKERDAETGMDYFGARYYLAALGRWGSVDPLGDSLPSWSAYQYVLGNPLAYVDPDGRQVNVTGMRAAFEHSPQPKAASAWDRLRTWFLNRLETSAANSMECISDPVCLATMTSGGMARVGGAATRASAASRLLAREEGARIAVNLPAWKTIAIDMEHVTSGHVAGGLRVSPKKTLFPEGMTTKQLERVIRQAYRGAKKVETQGDRVKLQGSAFGMKIEMWVNTADKLIETAYPVAEPR